MAETGYVSDSGSDSSFCGFTTSTPCRTLQHVTSLLSTNSTIYLLPEGPDKQESVFDPGENVSQLTIIIAVTVVGDYGK